MHIVLSIAGAGIVSAILSASVSTWMDGSAT
jgi:hypothetical protein